MQEKKHLLNLLKALAVLLIIYSHSDVLFPERLRMLATGGALGNSVFFILSGYFTSSKKGSWRNALIRYFRLYIPVYIILLVYTFTNNNYLARIHDFHSFFRVFIWPTPYWFVSASFVSYLLLEVIKKYINKKNCFIVLAIIMITYIMCYIWGIPNKQSFVVEEGKIFGWNIQFKCIYGFLLYVVGYLINIFNWTVQKNKATVLMITSFILTYVIKIFMQKGFLPMQIQFLTQFCVIGFAIGALMTAINYENQYRKTNEIILNSFDSISKVSLEAYVIQLLFIPLFANKVHIAFPINLIVSTALIILLSFVLYYVDSFIMRRLKRALIIGRTT